MIVCDVKLNVLSRMTIISLRQGRRLFPFIMFMLSCGSLCSVAIPRGALLRIVIVAFSDYIHLYFKCNRYIVQQDFG